MSAAITNAPEKPVEGERPSRLKADHLSLGYAERMVVDDLSLEIPTGKITMIVGPNACGKSTTLRALARLLPPKSGQVLLDGRSIQSMPTKQVATQLGILPQSPIAPEGITVADLVGRGRSPQQKFFRQWTSSDKEAVDRALAATGTLELADRPVDELSGGQRQRVWIAMTLAQDTELLLLDEPTTYLDLTHQIEVLDLLADLNETLGRTIAVVLHDLNLACRYSHHLVAMRAGKIIAQGAPADVITVDLVKQVFELPCEVIEDPVSKTPLLIPIGRHLHI